MTVESKSSLRLATMETNEPLSSPSSSSPSILVTLTARRLGPSCPFGNTDVVNVTVRRGGCVWLRGASGRGKTTLAMHLAATAAGNGSNSSLSALSQSQLQTSLHMIVDCEWDTSIPPSERCGVLFQQTTLLDELTVAGNLAVALQACKRTGGLMAWATGTSSTDPYYLAIKQLLTSVGLDYERDACKRPTQLSGGMARRAGLALHLAQQKHVIVLDEPFAGLDYDTAVGMAKELWRLRQTKHVGMVLISHEPELAQLVLNGRSSEAKVVNGDTNGDNGNDSINSIVELTEPPLPTGLEPHSRHHGSSSLYHGTQWTHRFVDRLVDYICYSVPLIALTFAATGTAISMLSADSLQRMDVTEPVLQIVDREVRPMIKLLTNEEPSVFAMMGVRFKVKQMLHETVPPAKAMLYAIGLTKLLVLEIGPLLTALLLCGRIGGSYAGRVAVLQSTRQGHLLQTLGISSWHWSWTPSLTAALAAGPVLTVLGTSVALVLAGWIGPLLYGIGTVRDYWTHVQSNLLPPLRLQGWVQYQQDTSTTSAAQLQSNNGQTSSMPYSFYQLDFYRTTHGSNGSSFHWIVDTLIEVCTYPIVFHIFKAVVFMTIIMTVADVLARRRQPHLTHRNVPHVITSSVVTASLLIICADWAFGRLWLQRR